MVSIQLKNISQIGSFPQVGVKIKIVRNHHPDNFPTFEKQHIPTSGCPPPFSNSWGTIATARSKHWELLLRCMAPWKKRRNGSALLGGDRYHPLQCRKASLGKNTKNWASLMWEMSHMSFFVVYHIVGTLMYIVIQTKIHVGSFPNKDLSRYTVPKNIEFDSGFTDELGRGFIKITLEKRGDSVDLGVSLHSWFLFSGWFEWKNSLQCKIFVGFMSYVCNLNQIAI